MSVELRNWDLHTLLAEVAHSKRRRKGKKETGSVACPRRPLTCSCRPSKRTGFQNRVRFMWNACALLRLHAWNFWTHGCYRANRFCKLCHAWLKHCWLLRKRLDFFRFFLNLLGCSFDCEDHFHFHIQFLPFSVQVYRSPSFVTWRTESPWKRKKLLRYAMTPTLLGPLWCLDPVLPIRYLPYVLVTQHRSQCMCRVVVLPA